MRIVGRVVGFLVRSVLECPGSRHTGQHSLRAFNLEAPVTPTEEKAMFEAAVLRRENEVLHALLCDLVNLIGQVFKRTPKAPENGDH